MLVSSIFLVRKIFPVCGKTEIFMFVQEICSQELQPWNNASIFVAKINILRQERI